MNKKIYIMGFLIIVTVLNGCFKKESKVPISQRKIKVVATTGMIADAVKVIGKNRVAVNALMGPGIDPHLYQASAGDVTSLAAADIIFYHGLHLEAKMGDILKKMAKRHKTVAVADQLPADKLLKSSDYEELYDPHIWFNVELWQAAVQVVRDALIELDPESRNYYYRNTARYLSELAQLHQTVHQQIKQIPEERRILITAHDAFNYFSYAYGIRVVGLQGVSTEAEASIKDVQRLVKIIINNNIPAIFVETSTPKRNILAVKEAVWSQGKQVKIGGELFADAMGDASTVEGTYIGMISHNVNAIVEGLIQEVN